MPSGRQYVRNGANSDRAPRPRKPRLTKSAQRLAMTAPSKAAEAIAARRPARRARSGGERFRLAGPARRRAAAFGQYGRGLWARRAPVSRLPRRAPRRAGRARGLRRPGARRPARLSRPAAGGRDQSALAAARALGAALALASHRPRGRRAGFRAWRGARAQGGATFASRAERRRRARRRLRRLARGRSA